MGVDAAMNDRWPTAWVILIGAAITVLVTIVPVILLLDFEPLGTIGLVMLTALLGAALGWLWIRLA
jgi:hypothetical protein